MGTPNTVVIYDRVSETTDVIGDVNDATLLGAVAGFRTFASVMSDFGNEDCGYCIANDDQWEVGIGRMVDAVTFARALPSDSSNAGNRVDWPVGVKTISLVVTGQQFGGLMNYDGVIEVVGGATADVIRTPPEEGRTVGSVERITETAYAALAPPEPTILYIVVPD